MSSASFRHIIFNALPGRVDTITASTGLHRSTVKKWLKDFYEKGQSHISGWKKGLNGCYVPRYSPGPGVDSPCHFLAPEGVDLNKYKIPPKASAIVIDALPGGFESLCKKAKLSARTIRQNLTLLHATGEIRIIRWERHSITLRPMPIYAKGSGPDAVCNMRRLTRAELQLRADAKKERLALETRDSKLKAFDEKYGIVVHDREIDSDGWGTTKARTEALAHADAASKNGDPMILALFGGKSKSKKCQEIRA